jgi:hypothetical protein
MLHRFIGAPPPYQRIFANFSDRALFLSAASVGRRFLSAASVGRRFHHISSHFNAFRISYAFHRISSYFIAISSYFIVFHRISSHFIDVVIDVALIL